MVQKTLHHFLNHQKQTQYQLQPGNLGFLRWWVFFFSSNLNSLCYTFLHSDWTLWFVWFKSCDTESKKVHHYLNLDIFMQFILYANKFKKLMLWHLVGFLRKDWIGVTCTHSLWWRANTQNLYFETLYNGQFTLSTQLIILSYPVILSCRRSTRVSSECYSL